MRLYPRAPPAIAIEQKVNTRNPRSTVGTSTEIYDYIRMLYGRIGRTYSPVTGEIVKTHGRRCHRCSFALPGRHSHGHSCTVHNTRRSRSAATARNLRKRRLYRVVDADGEFVEIEEYKSDALPLLLIDRMAWSEEPDEISRFAESAETAFSKATTNSF